ncbi:HAD family phosphatase [Neobacillus niacini]|uniref:HAD family hydrolase n=1 Tax=Neobacillus niacini TaxID=86668 RepID=UPI0021CB74F2|nr:HAD family phosphatase [Neobacillus niacini]MCM3764015.1 HAD family phosphatase [Neobacillus niacini]
MGKTNLVIFDMDGLLFDTEWPSYRAMKEVIETKGFDFPISYYRQMIGLHGARAHAVLDKLYAGELHVETVIKEYRPRFQELLETEGVALKPGAEQLLRWLEEQGIKKGIASSSHRDTIAGYLKRTGLERRFDFYLSGTEVERGKPHPDIFLEALRRAGESQESAFVLEDSLNGLKAAHAAGIRCVLVPDLIEPTDEMKEMAYAVVSDLEKVIQLFAGHKNRLPL